MKNLLTIFVLILFNPLQGISQESLFDIHLMHESVETGVVRRGMPVVLHLAIQSSQTFTLQEMEAGFEDSIPISEEYRHWLDSVYAPVKLTDTPAVWSSSFVLDIQSEGQKRSFKPEGILIDPQPVEVSWLYPDQPLHLFLGFDPEETSQWKPGKIRFKAGIIRSLDTLWSKPLSLSVTNASVVKMKQMNVEELVYVGGYFLRSDRCDKAKPYAEYIPDTHQPDFASTLLLAAIDECYGDTVAALRRYNEAYYLYYSQEAEHLEPPFHLMRKIGELQRQFLVPDEEP